MKSGATVKSDLATAALDKAVELRLVVGRLNRRLRVLSATGLTASQTSMLACLAAAGPLTLGEVAAKEGISAPTASRSIDHLVSVGLVRRRADPADGRRQSIALTAAGRRCVEDSADDATVLLAQAMTRRSGAERAALEQAIPALQELVADLRVTTEERS